MENSWISRKNVRLVVVDVTGLSEEELALESLLASESLGELEASVELEEKSAD
jgi:hypothetical protein